MICKLYQLSNEDPEDLEHFPEFNEDLTYFKRGDGISDTYFKVYKGRSL